MNADERAILAECRAGNLEGFSTLYDRYVSDIFKFVYFKTHHKETAEDLTSQVFVKALEHISDFDDTGKPFSAWLFSIARNSIIDFYRTKKAHANVEDIWDLTDDSDLVRDAQARMHMAKVQEYMKELTGEQRDIVMLRLWQDLPYKEIAAIVGKSEASCKMTFSRTIAKMRKDILLSCLFLVSHINF